MSPAATLQRAAKRNRGSAGPVEVWEIDLAQHPNPAGTVIAGVLSAAERRRGAALASARGRTMFVLTRTVLRQLLGARLGCGPAEVTIAETSHGKPVLGIGTSHGAGPESRLHFNVSHTDGRSIIALGDQPVGVDIERTDRSVEIDRAGELVLTPAERRHLRALEPAVRPRAFFALWARKEAVAKGIGLGLRLPIHTIDCLGDVVAVASFPADDLAAAGAAASRWHVVDLVVDGRHVAAVAVPGPRPHIQRRTWSGDPQAETGGCPS